MTNREFYTAIANANVSAEITEFAQGCIAKLDERNAKRSSQPSKVAIANEPLKVQIRGYLENHPRAVASVIGTELKLTTNKVSALCRQMVDAGLVTSENVKVKGKGSVKAYSLATTESAE